MQPQVDFYVLNGNSPGGKDGYACRIAAKAHARGLKVYMQTDDAKRAETLDALLWTFAQSSFVPHAVHSGATLDVEKYPVQIGVCAAPEGCTDVLISLCNEVPGEFAKFARVAELIANDEGDKEAGRARFKFYRGRGVEPKTYKVS